MESKQGTASEAMSALWKTVEKLEREADRTYWAPLNAELEELRRRRLREIEPFSHIASRFHDDLDSYIDGKTGFLLEILKETDLTRDELRRIEMSNRK